MRVSLLRTSTFRLALIYMVLFAGSVMILLGFIYWSTVAYMSEQTDATIRAEIAGLAEQYRQRGLNGLEKTISERVERDPDGSSVYLFATPNRQPLAGNLSPWPDATPAADGWLDFEFKDSRAGGRVFQARARVFILQDGLRLLVGRDTRELKATQQLITRALLWGVAITLALALLGGVIMSRGMLRRIELINQTSRNIMAGDLSQRIPIRGSGDELDQLAGNLNSMIDEIERLMDGIRHVSDNIAHDLRTPLTRLRNALEEAEHAADPDSARGHVEAALADADNLLRTFNALLRIARLESGSYETGHHRVELRTLVEDAAELYQAVAEDNEITLSASCSSKGEIEGDRDLLFQLLVNLIDNAVKYTPPGGVVEIRLDDVGANVNLTVCDTGPGVPESLRDRVLERFFRLDSSRRVAGNGLGLSLVQAIARHHDAVLELGENDPGLRVEVRFRHDASDSVP